MNTKKKTGRKPRNTVRETPEASKEAFLRLRDQFLEDSPLKSSAAKDALSEAAAFLCVHLGLMREDEFKGVLPAEISRTIPSVASNLLRVTKALEVTAVQEDEEEDGF